MSNSFLSFDVSGATKTEALGLNEDGQVVGFYVDSNGVKHAFIDRAGTITTFDDPDGSNTASHTAVVNGQTVVLMDGNTVATGINDPGQIVGYFYDSSDRANGFIDSKGNFTPLSPPGAVNTFPEDITENKQIVGYYVDNAGVDHGFIDSGGMFTVVNDPSADTTVANVTGNLGTVVTGVNNPGQVVGYYFDNNRLAHGFVEDTNGSNSDDNGNGKGHSKDNSGNPTFTTIDSTTVAGLGGASQVFVEGIAENRRIVGYYLDSANHAHGFVDDQGTITKIDSTTIAGLSGATDVFAQDINDEGQITGYYVNASGTHGFLVNGVGGDHIDVFDTSDDQDVGGTEETYNGPVTGLQHQFIYGGTDSVNISVSDDNFFLHGGPGEDAIAAQGGYNVLDGGTGSNFLTGGSGTDTFFVDDRNPGSDIWSTMNAFHHGDDATLFGITSSANIQWFDGQGASGFTGLTLHVTSPNAPTASLTLPGYSTSDLSNGRLSVQFGSETDGTPFMHIIAS